jgi:hypothetical protein
MNTRGWHPHGGAPESPAGLSTGDALEETDDADNEQRNAEHEDTDRDRSHHAQAPQDGYSREREEGILAAGTANGNAKQSRRKI